VNRTSRTATGLIALALACACSSPPGIVPLPAADADPLLRSCLARFPSGSFEVVHAIEATLPLGNASTVVGVSAWDAGSRTLSAALLAPEGIALFEASRFGKGDVSVTRALPPLDRPNFAHGLFEDLGFMYFAPGGGPSGSDGDVSAPQVGRYGDGSPVCRWSLEGSVVDLVSSGEGGFTLSEYRGSGEPVRRYEAGPTTSARGFPHSSRFQRTGPAGYSMRFTLVEQ